MAKLWQCLSTPACILPAPRRWQDASPRRCRAGCSRLWEAAVPPWRQERPHPAHTRGTGRELAKPGHCILAFRLSPGTLRPGEHAAARLPAMGQSWSRARAGSTDIPILTTAAGPSPRRSFSHGRVLAGKLRFPTGGCQGGFINCRPLLWLRPSPWGGQEPGDPPPHPVAVDRSMAMSGRRQGRGRGSGRLHGSSADSQGLPRLTQQLGVPGPASVAAALPAAQQRLPVPTGASHAGPGSLARAAAAQQVVGAGEGWRFGLAPTKGEWELPGRGSSSEAKQSILLPWWGSQGCELGTEASPCLRRSRGNRCPQPPRCHQCRQLWAARAQEPPGAGLAPPWGGSGVPHAHGTPSRLPPSLPASTCSSSIASSAHTTLPTARAG